MTRSRYTRLTAVAVVLIACAALSIGGEAIPKPAPDQQAELAADHALDASPAAELDVVVYVTKTGKCYHRKDCRFLRTSSIAMPISKARLKHRACKVCKPPK